MTIEKREDYPNLVKKIDMIYETLVSGIDDKPGLLERVRKLEAFNTTIKAITKVMVTLTAVNVTTIAVQIINNLIKN